MTEGDPLPKGASGRLGSVRLRHAGDIPSVCFSPDGRTILAGSAQAESAVYLWNAADGARRHRIPVAGGVGAVAYSPDGKRVAAVTTLSQRGDRGVLIWDEATGKMLHRINLPDEGAGKICFCPKGRQLAILVGDGVLLLWRAGQKARRLEAPKGWGTGLGFSPDGKRLAAGLFDLESPDKPAGYPLCVWDVASGKRTHLLLGHEDDVRALAFSRDGQRLFSGGWGEKNSVRVWDLDKSKELPALPQRKGEALAMWLSPDDKTLLVADSDGLVRGWRLPAGTGLKGLPKLAPARHGGNAVAFSADGQRLVMGSWLGSAGASNSIKLWDLTTGRRLLEQPGHEGDVCCLGFTADGKRLVSCAADGAILWDLRLRRVVRRFGPRKMRPDVVAISPNGALLAVSEYRREQIHLFDTVGGKELPAITWETKREEDEPPRESINWMRFSPDGGSLAASTGGRTALWPQKSREIMSP
jgi:WD40 repeat protein